MTRQERQTFEDEAIRTGTLTAFRLGKIIAMDECIELLNSFIKDDFNIALEIASIQFNMKKVELANKVLAEYTEEESDEKHVDRS